ncbi:efflux RND transporter periplasmic adaptor subunit [Alcaligenaceae bacterium]|nr:efflux RND transporter periplasmic adaptor subunit [Alcaligenaceae bacterium]
MSQNLLFTRAALYRCFPLLTSLLLASLLAGCHSQAAEEPTPNQPSVSIALVVQRQVIQWDDFNGRVEAVETIALRPRVSGHIEKINYREGQTVTRGDVLFEIDARSYRAALTRAEADLASALANASLARSEAARAQRLVSLKAVSTEELEQRRAASAQADASVQFARAAVETARLELDFTQVRAPISGRAGRALVTAGNLVSSEGTENILTTLVSLDPMHVHFDSDERTYLRYAQMVRTGERPDERNGGVPVNIGLVGEDGHPHAGQVDFIDNRLDPDTGTIRARATLSNLDGLLTPGLYARVRLQGSVPFKAVLVDDKAVMTDQDRKYVYIVDENDTAKRRDVSLGRLAEGLRIVEKGLQQGDRVIVNGIQKITHSGMPVQVQVVPMEPQRVALQSVGSYRE